jgi:hypothetical protein
LKPEQWGSPLVQEKYQEGRPVTEVVTTTTTTTTHTIDDDDDDDDDDNDDVDGLL